MTSPMPTGRAYEAASLIQPRIAGSSDTYSTSTRISPSPGSPTGSSVRFQSSSVGGPTGRLARRMARLELTPSPPPG
jgi:hypothetical protein